MLKFKASIISSWINNSANTYTIVSFSSKFIQINNHMHFLWELLLWCFLCCYSHNQVTESQTHSVKAQTHVLKSTKCFHKYTRPPVKKNPNNNLLQKPLQHLCFIAFSQTSDMICYWKLRLSTADWQTKGAWNSFHGYCAAATGKAGRLVMSHVPIATPHCEVIAPSLAAHALDADVNIIYMGVVIAIQGD